MRKREPRIGSLGDPKERETGKRGEWPILMNGLEGSAGKNRKGKEKRWGKQRESKGGEGG